MRPYEFFDNIQVSIAYELDLNYYKVEMQGYSGLDLLADIGGLEYSLLMLFSILMMLLHHNKMENYLVS